MKIKEVEVSLILPPKLFKKDHFSLVGIHLSRYFSMYIYEIDIIYFWLGAVVHTLREAKAGKSQGQEFETSLANMVKLHLY